MNPIERPLTGCTVGLSISESEESTQRGFPAWQVNRVTLQDVAALFGQGAGIVFGHDWREDGVMEAVHGFARAMQPPDPLWPDEARAGDQPLLRNLLPWPDASRLSEEDRERLATTLRVEFAGLPPELQPHDIEGRSAPPSSPLYRYLRARGLTHLRHRLDESCDARLCLGGRRGGSQGRYPGVIEEVYLAMRKACPIYLVGLLGGATSQVIDAIEGQPMPDDFCPPGPAHKLYDAPPITEFDAVTADDRQIDRGAVWSTFAATSKERLAEINGLTPEELDELFHTRVLHRATQLVLTGLSRIKR